MLLATILECFEPSEAGDLLDLAAWLDVQHAAIVKEQDALVRLLVEPEPGLVGEVFIAAVAAHFEVERDRFERLCRAFHVLFDQLKIRKLHELRRIQ